MNELDTIAIVGASDEACALAELAAHFDCAVRLHAPDRPALARARDLIRAGLDARAAAGAIERGDRQRVLDHILATTNLDAALTHARVVVVSAAAHADGALLDRVAAGSAASALVGVWPPDPADALADLVRRFPQPGRVLGLRFPFANGGARAAEILAASLTAPHAIERACRFARRLGREPEVRRAGDGVTDRK